jgi:hypothetical protein
MKKRHLILADKGPFFQKIKPVSFGCATFPLRLRLKTLPPDCATQKARAVSGTLDAAKVSRKNGAGVSKKLKKTLDIGPTGGVGHFLFGHHETGGYGKITCLSQNKKCHETIIRHF